MYGTFNGKQYSNSERTRWLTTVNAPAIIPGQHTTARTIRSILVSTVVLRTTCLAVRQTITSTPPRSTRETNRRVTFLEPTTDLSTTAYKPVTTTASESVFALEEGSADHTNSYITVCQDLATTKVPHSDRDEEQIHILNRSKNRSPSLRPQTRYVRPSDVPHADVTNLANRPWWQTWNRMTFHHRYTPRHIYS